MHNLKGRKKIKETRKVKFNNKIRVKMEKNIHISLPVPENPVASINKLQEKHAC